MCASAVWLESSLGAFWIAKDAICFHADIEYSILISLRGCAGRFFSLRCPHVWEGTFSHVSLHIIIAQSCVKGNKNKYSSVRQQMIKMNNKTWNVYDSVLGPILEEQKRIKNDNKLLSDYIHDQGKNSAFLLNGDKSFPVRVDEFWSVLSLKGKIKNESA